MRVVTLQNRDIDKAETLATSLPLSSAPVMSSGTLGALSQRTSTGVVMNFQPIYLDLKQEERLITCFISFGNKAFIENPLLLS